MMGSISMVGTARCAVRRRFAVDKNRRQKAFADAAARRPYQVLLPSMTLVYFGRRFVPEQGSLQERRYKNDAAATDHVVPEIPDVGGEEEDEHERLRDDGGEEDGG